MSTDPRSIVSKDEQEPKRMRSVETALLLLLALATVFNWQNLKSIDAWLFGVRVNRSVPPVAPPVAGQHFSASPPAELLRAGSGPMALACILFYHGAQPSPAVLQTLQQSNSTAQSLSLGSVQQISDAVGLHYQMAFRSAGAPVIVPAVVHFKLGHYAAVVDHLDERYLIEDSSVGDAVHMSAATLDQEASGYFLVPTGALPSGWRVVLPREGETV